MFCRAFVSLDIVAEFLIQGLYLLKSLHGHCLRGCFAFRFNAGPVEGCIGAFVSVVCWLQVSVEASS